MSGSGGGLDPNKVANHFTSANNTFDLGLKQDSGETYTSGGTLIVDGTSTDSGEL